MALALLTTTLFFLSCTNKPGRYQMVVTPPFEGDSRYWGAQVYVLDTQTGRVYKESTQFNRKGVFQWDPINATQSWKATSLDSVATDFLSEPQ